MKFIFIYGKQIKIKNAKTISIAEMDTADHVFGFNGVSLFIVKGQVSFVPKDVMSRIEKLKLLL